MEKLKKTDKEWQEVLTEEQYTVTRRKGTEPAFCGAFFDHKKPGTYYCVCCDLPLFSSNHKFDSGTGWPSFYQAVVPNHVEEKIDLSHGMIRMKSNAHAVTHTLGTFSKTAPNPLVYVTA